MVKSHLLVVAIATFGLVPSLTAGSPLHMAGLQCHGQCSWPDSPTVPIDAHLGAFTWDGSSLIDDAIVEIGVTEQMQSAAFDSDVSNRSARIVATGGDDTLGNVVDNVSDPARWTQMRYGPVQFSIAIPTSESPTAIRFWHNGQAAHPDLVLPQSQWEAVIENGRSLFQRNFLWSSPPLGKSNLQVEIKVGNRWSQLSRPLQLEIVAPQKPVVVAVGTHSSQLLPWDEKLGVVHCDSTLLVQLANLPTGVEVLADIHGYGSLPGTTQSNDVVEFDLAKAVTSGRYRVSLRYASGQTIDMDGATAATVPIASMTGDRSAPLWVDFYNAQQQISLNNDYAKIHHQALNAWLAATPTDPMAAALSKLANEIGMELTTNSAATLKDHAQSVYDVRNTRGRTRAVADRHANVLLTAVQPPEQVQPAEMEATDQTFDAAIDKQIELLNAIERVKQWKAVREQVRHAIASSDYVTDVAFDTPVVFPRRSYGPGAEEFAIGGLTILEGMQLKVAANGDYCLSFSYVPPPVPCTVNLQLQFRTDSDGPWHSLTIAPMTLKSVRELDQPSNEVTHVVQGHSQRLAKSAGDISAVRRRGSATFGFGHKILQSGQNY